MGSTPFTFLFSRQYLPVAAWRVARPCPPSQGQRPARRILSAPVRETFSFSASQRSLTTSCRGPGVPTIRHVPCPAESKGKKPAHHLSRAKSSSPASPAPQAEAPSATGKQNATPGSPPALSGLFLSGRRKKRPARTRCLAVPGQKAFSQGQPCSVGAFQFEALHVNPAACRFAAKNAVSPLTFGRTALCHSAPDKWARMGGAGYRPAETSFLAGPVRYARHRKKTAHRRYRQGQAHCGLTKTCNTISYNLSM